MTDLFAVILAGGGGTRFWPASRRLHPKQLLSLGTSDGQCLLARSVDRIASICPPDNILISTGRHLIPQTRRALPSLPSKAFLEEPVPRNTAPCIGWATQIVHQLHPGAVVMVLPSDHLIGNLPAFHDAIRTAVQSANTGVITTLGIEPSRPDTGYGYIEVGETIATGVRRGVRFVEKPDRDTARAYVDSGNYVWNAGMFFFQTTTMLDAIARFMPSLAQGLVRIQQVAGSRTAQEHSVPREIFESLPSISIDYGIMERLTTLNVVPADIDWSDLGSWESLWELGAKDEHLNVLDGNALAVQSSRNLVRSLGTQSKGKVIALVGVEDLCVVDTDDALLVLPRSRAQDVREIVQELERRGLERHL